MSCQGWFLWPLTYPCSLNLGLAEAPGPNGTQLSGASTKHRSEDPCPGKSSDSCQVHQRKTTQDQGDSLTDWPANTNLLTPDVEHVEQCSKAISYKSQICRTEAKLQTRKTLWNLPHLHSNSSFSSRRGQEPRVPAAARAVALCLLWVPPQWAMLRAAPAGTQAALPRSPRGIQAWVTILMHSPGQRWASQWHSPISHQPLSAALPQRNTTGETEMRTKPKSLVKGMSVPIAKLHSFTSIRAPVCIPRSLLSLDKGGYPKGARRFVHGTAILYLVLNFLLAIWQVYYLLLWH